MNADVKASDLLLVDDNPMNLGVLSEILRTAGYRLRFALNGRKALEAVQAQKPDLVLMDITMPELDGYEACAALKADPDLAAIPVIFLSAHDAPLDKVRAFAAGGADYVQKPYHAEEVLARVTHHLRLSGLQATLELRNRELQASNERLAELDRLKTRFAAMLVHDLRNPLAAVGSTLEMLEDMAPAEQLEALTKFNHRCVDQIGRCLSFLENLLEVYRGDAKGLELHPQAISCPGFLQGLIDGRNGQAGKAVISLALDLPEPEPLLPGDPAQLARVVDNLLANAQKFTAADGHIRVQVDQVRSEGADPDRGWIRIRVGDDGRGIPAEELPFIFDPYRQAMAHDAERGSGLGLAIVARIVAAHHGRVSVQSQIGVGTTFTVLLPS
jgi:two-component system sensor histidine kinase/response regulator